MAGKIGEIERARPADLPAEFHRPPGLRSSATNHRLPSTIVIWKGIPWQEKLNWAS